MADNKELLVERADPVAWLTINRPQQGNALNAAVLDAIVENLGALAGAGETRCVVLRGSGDRFSVGMDLRMMALMTPKDNQRLIGAGGPLRWTISAIESFPYPVIASVSGHAVGAACELAMSCDLRVGCGASCMGMPPAKLGIVYPPEGLERFIGTLGLPVTRKLFLTAKYFMGPELYNMGMLDFLVSDAELEGFTKELAHTIAQNAPQSLKGHKQALRLLTDAASLAPEAKAEIDSLVTEALHSSDATEGIASFLEKRRPSFKGE